MIESDLSSYQRIKKQAGKAIKFKNFLRNLLLEIDVFHIIYTVLGLIIGRAFLSTQLLPFGLSFLALIIYQYLYRNEKLSRVVLFVFSIYLGYYNILGLSWALGKYLLSGLVFTFLASYAVKYREGNSKLEFSLLNGGVLLVIEVITLVLAARFFYNDLFLLLGAALVMILTFILLMGLSPLFYAETKQPLNEINILALLITLAILNIGLPNIEVGIINLPRVFSSLVVMSVALISGGAVATVVGAVMGLVYSISNLYVVEVTGLYALAGLIGGNFNKEGKLGVIIGFFLTTLVYTVLLIEVNDINAILGESLLAAGFLLLIPAKLIGLADFLIPDLIINSQNKQQNKLSQKAIKRVDEIKNVFMEIVKSFEQPAAEALEVQNNNLDELLNIVSNQVCLNCKLYNICWEQNFFKTYQRCLEVLSTAENEGEIKSRKLNQIMEGNCKFPRKLSSGVNRFLEKHELNSFWHKKLKDSQEVISNQVIGLVEILEELAADLEVEIKLDNDLKKVVQSELESYGIFIEELMVLDDDEVEEIEISLNKKSCAGERECTAKVLPTLNKILKQRFKIKWSKCGASLGEKNCSLKIVSALKYQVDTGLARAKPQGAEISGDDYKVVNVDNKEVVAILSDGMGTGKRAALESKSTVNLLEKLVAAGFDKELAIRTVNSALLLRSTEEVFATVDLTAIDRCTGQADLIKIGSAPTFIKRSSRDIEVIKSSSLPIGIIDNIDIKLNRRLKLEAGDMVVMLTDGVIDSQQGEIKQEEWMKRLLKNCVINDTQSLADYILEQALDSKSEIKDDMTVLVVKLSAYYRKLSS